MGARADSSAIRQTLRRIAQQIGRQVEAAREVRGEAMPASLSKTHKVCGRPSCKCARGEKHEVYQLSWTEEGRRRSAHIRKKDLARVRAAVEGYRDLRRCRAEMLKLASEAATLIDALVEALQVMPPGKSEERHG